MLKPLLGMPWRARSRSRPRTSRSWRRLSPCSPSSGASCRRATSCATFSSLLLPTPSFTRNRSAPLTLHPPPSTFFHAKQVRSSHPPPSTLQPPPSTFFHAKQVRSSPPLLLSSPPCRHILCVFPGPRPSEGRRAASAVRGANAFLFCIFFCIIFCFLVRGANASKT